MHTRGRKRRRQHALRSEASAAAGDCTDLRPAWHFTPASQSRRCGCCRGRARGWCRLPPAGHTGHDTHGWRWSQTARCTTKQEAFLGHQAIIDTHTAAQKQGEAPRCPGPPRTKTTPRSLPRPSKHRKQSGAAPHLLEVARELHHAGAAALAADADAAAERARAAGAAARARCRLRDQLDLQAGKGAGRAAGWASQVVLLAGGDSLEKRDATLQDGQQHSARGSEMQGAWCRLHRAAVLHEKHAERRGWCRPRGRKREGGARLPAWRCRRAPRCCTAAGRARRRPPPGRSPRRCPRSARCGGRGGGVCVCVCVCVVGGWGNLASWAGSQGAQPQQGAEMGAYQPGAELQGCSARLGAPLPSEKGAQGAQGAFQGGQHADKPRSQGKAPAHGWSATLRSSTGRQRSMKAREAGSPGHLLS